MIDWTGLMQGYNRRYGTSHKTEKEFLAEAYTRFNRSVTEMSRRKNLYVCIPTLCTKMKSLDVPYLGKGHRYPGPKVRAILALKTENMTRKQIAKVTGIGLSYCWILLNKLKLPWKRIPPGRRTGS
jgi:hypothetical protein